MAPHRRNDPKHLKKRHPRLLAYLNYLTALFLFGAWCQGIKASLDETMEIAVTFAESVICDGFLVIFDPQSRVDLDHTRLVRKACF
jgi:hypothetical protein